MKPDGYKEVQVLLKTGQALKVYMDESHLEVMKSKRFIAGRSDNNVVWFAPEELIGFEVVDDRENKIQADQQPESAAV